MESRAGAPSGLPIDRGESNPRPGFSASRKIGIFRTWSLGPISGRSDQIGTVPDVAHGRRGDQRAGGEQSSGRRGRKMLSLSSPPCSGLPTSITLHRRHHGEARRLGDLRQQPLLVARISDESAGITKIFHSYPPIKWANDADRRRRSSVNPTTEKQPIRHDGSQQKVFKCNFINNVSF
jgi:hypothetical protein